MRDADLAMQIFVGRGDIAAAEPHPDGIALDQDRWIADHFAIPALCARERTGELLPGYAIHRPGQAQPAIFGVVAPGVEHPIPAVRLPDSGFTEVLVESAIRADLENGIRPQLFPTHSVAGSRHAHT